MPLSVLPTPASSVYLDDDEMREEWEAMQAEDEDTLVSDEYWDYSQHLDNISILLLYVIFALGVITGLIMARDMWRRMSR